MPKFSHRQLLALANEERQTARLYQQMGLWRFARDERKHAFVFGKMAQKVKK